MIFARLRPARLRQPSPEPSEPTTPRDVYSRQPRPGELWVVEEIDWNLTATHALPGEIYARYTIKRPGMAIGDAGSAYASGEALHKAAISMLTQQFLYMPASHAYSVRFFYFNTGDRGRILERQQAHQAERRRLGFIS